MDLPIIDVEGGGFHSAFITKDQELYMCGSGEKG
jgi:alpha-tubulin suppressor-like RCC1 family protein